MLTGTVDVMMLGRVSEVALAAGALGHVVAMGHLILGMALLLALDPLIAQAWGAGDEQRVANVFLRGLVVSLAVTVPVTGSMLWFASNLDLLGQSDELLNPAGQYLIALLPGNLAFLIYGVLRSTLQSMRVVRPAVEAIVVANVFNVFANLALVFGYFGFPALGVSGSALATSLSRWVLVVSLLFFGRRRLFPLARRFQLAAVHMRGLVQVLVIGCPIALHVGIEYLVFSVVALIMGSLGAVPMAAHQIAINLASLSFMVPLGIGQAASTVVGNAIGREAVGEARVAAGLALASGSTVMLAFAVLFATLPQLLAGLYTTEPEVIALAAGLIPIAAIFQLGDGVQAVASGVLRGLADTRVPALLAFVGFWVIGLPLGWWLTFRRGMGPEGLWWGLTVGLSIVAILLALRIRTRFRGTVRAVEAL